MHFSVQPIRQKVQGSIHPSSRPQTSHNPRPRGRFKTTPSTVSLLLASTLDSDLISARLGANDEVRLVSSNTDLLQGVFQIEQHRPKLVVLDPRIHVDSLDRVQEIASQGLVNNLLVLDDRLREGLVVWALSIPRTSYLTRECEPDKLLSAIRFILQTSERVFDTELEDRIDRSSRKLRLLPDENPASITQLTSREREVLQHIARGGSVRDCAAKLQVAASTVDNHKSRIMRKLGVHKTSQLVSLAIREGLVLI